MKKRLLASLMCLCCLTLWAAAVWPASAATSGTTGSCTWTLNGTVLTISGNGAMGNYLSDPAPWSTAMITEAVIGDSVTNIGHGAFSNCTHLTNVMIGSNVTSIGRNAFSGCTGLTSIKIPKSVTSIGPSAFELCTGLTSITIPNSVTWMFETTFLGCSGLTSIKVQVGNSVYHSSGNCLIDTQSKTLLAGCQNSVIPTDGSVTSIGNFAFFQCTGLTSVTIPDSVTSIGDSAFYYCTGLTSVTIPDSVTSIGNSAFMDCTGLTSITIPNSVTSIGYRVFESCTGLTSVTIGNSVTSIGYWAFYNCHGLTSVTIPDSVTSIGPSAFELCTGLTSVTIPATVTSISERTFNGCEGLTSITIPNSVTSIGDEAFFVCSGLTSVTIPSGVTSIGKFAFWRCTGLTSITIPATVTSIGDEAFYDCPDLTVYCYKNSYANQYAQQNEIPCVYLKYTNTTVPAAPALSKKTATTVTLTPVSGYEYSMDGATWQTNNVFTGLSPATTYSFYQRVAETNTTYAGPAGDALLVTTDISCTWTLAGTTLTVSASGPMPDYDPFDWEREAPWWGEDFTRVIIESGTTGIGDFAFYDCTGLIDVTVPAGVTSIGAEAFESCTGLTSITIPASVTSIGEYVFYNCNNVTIYCYKDSYAEQYAVQNGIAYAYLNQGSTTLPASAALTFFGASLTLQNNLKVNFAVTKDQLDSLGYTQPYVVFGMNGSETTVTDYTVADGYYIFSFSNIAPHRMNDTITATLYATCGGQEYAGDPIEYSIAAYCYSQLGKTDDADLRTLLVDLLHYGAASQLYAGYRTDALVDANLTAEQLAWGTPGDPLLTSVTNGQYQTVAAPSVAWVGVALNLRDAITMQFAFTAADVSGVTVRVENGSGALLKEIAAAEFEAAGGYYIAGFNGLTAGQMSETVYVTAYKNDEAISNTLAYSIESYACAKQNDANTTLAALVKALMKYGNAAHAYAQKEAT